MGWINDVTAAAWRAGRTLSGPLKKTGEVRAQGREITISEELEDVLRKVLWAPESNSGISVSPDRAMRVMGVYACVRTLSETVAQTPLIVYRRLPDGDKERATDHWLYRLLHDQPNPWQTSFEWREMMQAHLALRGNAYSIKNIVRGRTVELLPVSPDLVGVEQLPDYTIKYTVRFPDGRREEVPADMMLHLRGLAMNGVTGINPIQYAREAVGLSLATERHGANLFGNGARPSGVLSTDQVLNDEQIQRIAESWKAAHGQENSGGTAVLDGNMQWKPLTMTSEDSQFLETRKFQKNEIATMFRIPPHMIGDLDRATFSNIEEQSLSFVMYTMMPWFSRWESAVTAQLLPAEERGEIFAEFLVDGLLRGDIKSRYEAYQIAVQNGWMSPDDVRERENMNRRPDGRGGEYKSAANLYGYDEGGSSDSPPPA